MLEKCKITGFADEIDTCLEVQVKVIKVLGISWLEFRSGNGKGVLDYSLAEAEILKEKLKAEGVRISAVGSPVGKISIKEDFEPHFNSFRHVAELAKLWETPYIRVFSFYMPKGEDVLQYKDEVMGRMSRMVEYAKEQNVILLHENEKGIYGDAAVRCLELMETFYGENFKAVFDFANFVQCRQDTWEAYEMLAPYIHYIHIKDAVWEDGHVVPAGQGDGQVRRILKKLDEGGYEGFLSLEPHLVNFSGLKNLESDREEKKMTDGARAFKMAYEALKGLMLSQPI